MSTSIFGALKSVIIQGTRALTHSAAAIGNLAEAADVATSVTIVQATAWKKEALNELNSIKEE